MGNLETLVQRCSIVLLEVRRVIEQLVGGLADVPDASLLDVGCWDGEVTQRYARALRAHPYGVEIASGPAAVARERGVTVAELDLERETLPWADGSMTVAVANQVFEHLKNIWLPLAELHRVLAPGGYLVFSVPNLASLHNRVLLGLGRQPTSIRTVGPHVRGFTTREVRRVLTLGGAFELIDTIGVGLYPLRASRLGWLARRWPNAAHTMVLVLRKTGRPEPWTALLDADSPAAEQTHYPAATGNGPTGDN